jgi:hypothetical protein
MGYDPYGSVSKPGKRDDMASAWEDDEKEERLPHWATDWPADVEKPCEAGTQCAGGVGNPLGVIGKWVMQATSAQGNAKRDWELRHNCVGLPVSDDTAHAPAHLFALLMPRDSIISAHFSKGWASTNASARVRAPDVKGWWFAMQGWAVEECFHMREKEKQLAKNGKVKEPEEEKKEKEEKEEKEGDKEEGEEGEGEAKKARTTSLAQREGQWKRELSSAQQQIDALARKGGMHSSAAPMRRTLRARGGAQAAEESGQVVVVPSRDVRFA